MTSANEDTEIDNGQHLPVERCNSVTILPPRHIMQRQNSQRHSSASTIFQRVRGRSSIHDEVADIAQQLSPTLAFGDQPSISYLSPPLEGSRRNGNRTRAVGRASSFTPASSTRRPAALNRQNAMAKNSADLIPHLLQATALSSGTSRSSLRQSRSTPSWGRDDAITTPTKSDDVSVPRTSAADDDEELIGAAALVRIVEEDEGTNNAWWRFHDRPQTYRNCASSPKSNQRQSEQVADFEDKKDDNTKERVLLRVGSYPLVDGLLSSTLLVPPTDEGSNPHCNSSADVKRRSYGRSLRRLTTLRRFHRHPSVPSQHSIASTSSSLGVVNAFRKKSARLLSSLHSAPASLAIPLRRRRQTRSDSCKERERRKFDRQNRPVRKQGIQHPPDSFEMDINDEACEKKNPHLFVQLDELYLPCDDTGKMEFKETGRWIKYEECIESGSEKWGKPQVSSLSFHSLLELRQCIENGTIMLDLYEPDVPTALEQIVAIMHHHEQIATNDQLPLLDVLLLRHKHVSEGGLLHIGRQRSYNSLSHYFYRQQSLMSPMPHLSPESQYTSHANLASAARLRQNTKHSLLYRGSRAGSISNTPVPGSLAVSRDKINDVSETVQLLSPRMGHRPSIQGPNLNVRDRRPSLDPSQKFYAKGTTEGLLNMKLPTFHVAPPSLAASHDQFPVADKLEEDDEGEKRARDDGKKDVEKGKIEGLPPKPSRNGTLPPISPLAVDKRHLFKKPRSPSDVSRIGGTLTSPDSSASLGDSVKTADATGMQTKGLAASFVNVNHRLDLQASKESSASMSLIPHFAVTHPPSHQPSLHTAQQLQAKKMDSEIAKRLPKDSESASIMVGAVNFLQKPTVAFVRFDEPLEIPEVMEVPNPVRFLFLLFGPLNTGIDYHEIGRSIGTLLSNKQFRERAYNAQHRDDLIEAINEFLDTSMVLPPGDWDEKSLINYDQMKTRSHAIQQRRAAAVRRPSDLDELLEEEKERMKDDPLRRTGRWFGGLRQEARRRYSLYCSDVTDACSWRTLTTVIFTFLTCLIPALTYGAILSEATDGWLGVTETLIATSIGGVIFALFSAQPLLVVGVCGPMLIFEDGLYNFCHYYELSDSLLMIRFWSSVWAFFFVFLTVAWEGPFIIRYVTPFSDDIITALVSVIFFADCYKFISKMFIDHPIKPLSTYCSSLINVTKDTMYSMSTTEGGLLGYTTLPELVTFESQHDNFGELTGMQPNVALLACILVGITFLVAFTFRKMENSRYFGRQVRKTLGDIGLSLAVIMMVFLDWLLLKDDNFSSKLKINKGFVPTLHDKRGWLVIPWPVEPWVPGAAILPGFVLYLIIFVETEACQLILAKKSRGLRKGTGYHLDLLLSGVLLVLSSIFGLPWLTADSVRSIAHVNSLTKYRLRAPGQKPKVDSVVEQRITSLVLNTFIGLTLLLLATDILSKIPVAILFGVFLYLGVMNLTGVEMLERTILFFVPSKHHPDVVYTKRVSSIRMHMYTLLQLVCFAVVCCIKSIRKTAWAFPFAILLAIAVRHLIVPKFFTDYELHALDAHEGSPDADADNDDLYERGMIASALCQSPRGSNATSATD